MYNLCNALTRLVDHKDEDPDICFKLKTQALAAVTKAIEFHPNDEDLAKGVKNWVNLVL